MAWANTVAAALAICSLSKMSVLLPPFAYGGDPFASVSIGHRQRDRRSAADTDCPRRRRAQIDDAPPHEWTAIVDPHHYRPTVAIIEYVDMGSEWKRSMGGGHGGRIHVLAVRGSAAAVDRGDTAHQSLDDARERGRIGFRGLANVLRTRGQGDIMEMLEMG
jgi:hypothetical protein